MKNSLKTLTWTALLGFAVALNFISCSANSKPLTEAQLRNQIADLGYTFTVSPGFSRSELQALYEDLSSLDHLEFAFNKSPDWFVDIFKGEKPQNIKDYLNERIQFLVKAVRSSSTPTATAENVSMGIVYDQIRVQPNRLAIKIQNQVSIMPEFRTPRIGLIQIYDLYFQQPEVLRLGMLIHEARHSDCANPPSSLKDFEQGASLKCGFSHYKCPPTHKLAGLPACELPIWGAYAVSAIYFSALIDNCTRCSEEQKQQALIHAADSMSRIDDYNGLVEGRFGSPEMESDGAGVEEFVKWFKKIKASAIAAGQEVKSVSILYLSPEQLQSGVYQ